jgi:hypothetical protein
MFFKRRDTDCPLPPPLLFSCMEPGTALVEFCLWLWPPREEGWEAAEEGQGALEPALVLQFYQSLDRIFMEPLLLSSPILLFLSPRPHPLWILQRFGAYPRVLWKPLQEMSLCCPICPSCFPSAAQGPLWLRSLGVQGSPEMGVLPTSSTEALRHHQCARQIGASVSVCACVRAQICTGAVHSRGPGRHGCKGSCCDFRTLPPI